MSKNIVIAALVIIAIVEGAFIFSKSSSANPDKKQVAAASTMNNADNVTPAKRPAPMILSKGMKLADSPIAKFAFQIAPGALADDAKAAMVGFAIKTQNNSDGTKLVSLTPKDSDDQSQQYTIKPGETLYFIEQTPVDDKADSDKDFNYRDDYGVITDASGIVQ